MSERLREFQELFLLDFGGDTFYNLLEFLFLGFLAGAVAMEQVFNLFAEVVTFFGGEKQGGSGTYNCATEESIK